jgi:glycogen synthase
MRVLMLGWEFPPYISGGLGTACHGLTKALSDAGTNILFVLPQAIERAHASHVRLLHPRARVPAMLDAKSPQVVFRAVPAGFRRPY